MARVADRLHAEEHVERRAKKGGLWARDGAGVTRERDARGQARERALRGLIR